MCLTEKQCMLSAPSRSRGISERCLMCTALCATGSCLSPVPKADTALTLPRNQLDPVWTGWKWSEPIWSVFIQSESVGISALEPVNSSLICLIHLEIFLSKHCASGKINFCNVWSLFKFYYCFPNFSGIIPHEQQKVKTSVLLHHFFQAANKLQADFLSTKNTFPR